MKTLACRRPLAALIPYSSSGSLVPGLENQVFILVAYPDGTPARAELRVRASGFADQTATTDQSGIATIEVPGATTKLQVEARDREGNRASVPVQLEARSGMDEHSSKFEIRADAAIKRARERGVAFARRKSKTRSR